MHGRRLNVIKISCACVGYMWESFLFLILRKKIFFIKVLNNLHCKVDALHIKTHSNYTQVRGMSQI